MEAYNYYRKSIRLKNYDYSQNGYYFVTICTNRMECLFGKIAKENIELNKCGEMVKNCWYNLLNRFDTINLDEFVIMPDHFHGIIQITNDLNNDNQNDYHGYPQGAPLHISKNTLGEIIGAFKSITTYKYIKNVYEENWSPINKRLWQHNYYEHIVRNEIELNIIRKYIVNNPIKLDSYIEKFKNM